MDAQPAAGERDIKTMSLNYDINGHIVPEAKGKPGKVTLMNKKAMKSAPLGQHKVKRVPIQRVKTGDWTRPSWNPHVPFRKTDTGGIHDKAYYMDDEEDPENTKMYTMGYKGSPSFEAHMPEGTAMHVLFRDRRNK